MFHQEDFLSDTATVMSTGTMLPPNTLLPSSGAAAGSDATSANQASNDAQLFTTLCEIDKNNYLYLFERCKAYNINARQLRFLEKEHIRRIIPPDQVGIMAEFEYLHHTWRKQFEPAPQQQPPSTAVVTPAPPVVASPHLEVVTAAPVTTSSIELQQATATIPEKVNRKPIIKRRSQCRERTKCRSLKGNMELDKYELDEIIQHDMRKIREKYKMNGILTESDRRYLAAALVDYFRESDIYMSKDIMECLAVQISTIFPTESKLAWHDAEGRQRRGRLTLKLYNTQRSKKLKRYNRYQEADDAGDDDEDETKILSNSNANVTVHISDQEAERLCDWMCNNKFEDNDELTQMWYETSSYRMEELRKYKTRNGYHLDDVFAKWPAYAQAIGHTLISIDFNTIQPRSENLFFERWPIFMEKIDKLYKLEVRLELYDRYYKNENSLSEETKQSIFVQLLHAVVRPTRAISPKQQARRYSIAESQNAFCTMITHQSEMDNYAAAHPMLFIIGSALNVEKSFVAFRNVRYELRFMDAFFTCLQIFFVFKIDFPLACLNFWTFVHKYFADIAPEPEINVAAVDHIIKFLLA